MLGVWALAALACILALAAPPPAGAHGGGQQALDLIRILSTAGLAVTLLFAPGTLWRIASSRHISLGFMGLPGIMLLAATGGLAWALAGTIEPRVVCFAVLAPLMGLLLGALLASGPEDVFSSEEHWVFLVVGCALGFTIARAVWSLGPEGELYQGGISRTLEVGDRPDSRIPYVIVQLVAHGTAPFSDLSNSYFAPYSFSSRGPIPGLASAPVVLMAGGKPPAELPEISWQPFDLQGFMAYRIAMMAFASTAFLALWDLVRRIGGSGPARLALLLAATTPFLVHEVWFTWPKLLGASFVLLAGICIVERRALRSGLLLGMGYLMHPGALVYLSMIGPLALWPLKKANWRRPDLKAGLLMLAGVVVSVLAWRLVNGSHYDQSGFTEYLEFAGTNLDPSPYQWLTYRAASVLNTFIPMALPIFYGDNYSINVVGGISPTSIHFFFQYWTGLPFGAGVVFFPLLLLSLWRAWRLWRWPVLATVVIPLVAFATYWGASSTGILREGLQAWLLVVLAVVALQQWRAGFPWLKSTPIRAILILRPLELLLIAIGPTLATRHLLIDSTFAVNDITALTAMIVFSAGLAALVWSTSAESLAESDSA